MSAAEADGAGPGSLLRHLHQAHTHNPALSLSLCLARAISARPYRARDPLIKETKRGEKKGKEK